MSSRKHPVLLPIIGLLLVATMLAGCGRRGAPEVPTIGDPAHREIYDEVPFGPGAVDSGMDPDREAAPDRPFILDSLLD